MFSDLMLFKHMRIFIDRLEPINRVEEKVHLMYISHLHVCETSAGDLYVHWNNLLIRVSTVISVTHFIWGCIYLCTVERKKKNELKSCTNVYLSSFQHLVTRMLRMELDWLVTSCCGYLRHRIWPWPHLVPDWAVSPNLSVT